MNGLIVHFCCKVDTKAISIKTSLNITIEIMCHWILELSRLTFCFVTQTHTSVIIKFIMTDV